MDRERKCRCGKTAVMDVGDYIGRQMESSGWLSVPTWNGTFVWLCGECGAEAKRLAGRLLDVVGDRDIHFSSLVRDREE